MKPDRIRAIQKSRGLSCRQFADLCGVPMRTMESYIQGRRNPPEWVVVSILAVEAVNQSEKDKWEAMNER